jgi:hypothetical protein
MFETQNGLTDNNIKIFSEIGVSPKEFVNIVKFLGKTSYPDIIEAMPFFNDFYSKDITISTEQAKTMLDFYNKRKNINNRTDDISDYLLSDDDDDVEFIKINHNRICVKITATNFSEMIPKLEKIEKYILRSGSKYRIETMKKEHGEKLEIYIITQ